ncbi:CPBP family intramembrane metalloprotease [Corynebacterium sp. ES2794-CONJ1]|uniref:CPBP family intramembrane glutamic endopeptidase n=1 Tax=Corynebacterium sp. ES2794-CONJ1 TaxID=2980553 RepID=UPI0021DB1459|nr:CPBP family intramembrane glutamic endopeptidase [Corynebacterium sp. ES2794-CONJ1]MCU9519578.1 CPBP family intramembrane metalloprotease [Corynebacterium sp. ES2794-CONJ1]
MSISATQSEQRPWEPGLGAEIVVVLLATFGTSGLRALLNLARSLLDTKPLNAQQVAIVPSRAPLPLIDIGFQLTSIALVFSWGFLCLYLLKIRLWPVAHLVHSARLGVGLAALIGIPGLLFYLGALHLGLSKQVIPVPADSPWWHIGLSVGFAAANAFSEEVVVVLWLMTRLKSAGVSQVKAIASSALLRGSHHLYQGISAGVGNIIMGIVFGYVYHKTNRVWPLIFAHFFIDLVAFVGSVYLNLK